MLSRNNVIIIDDNEALCQSLEFAFNAINSELKVSYFLDPSSFLNRFSPDWRGCLIIDLFMPYLNGFELLKELKLQQTQLHAIIMSGHASEKTAAQATNAGAAAFFSKPFKIHSLIEKVFSLLDLTFPHED